MKKIIFPLLSVLMLVFSSCMKTKPSVTDFANVPAIVTFNIEVPAYMLVTPYGAFYSSELPSEYSEGAKIWIDFTYDEGNQPYANVMVASNLIIHDRISTSYVRGVPKEELSDDYDAFIYKLFVTTNIGKTFFFGFVQKAPEGQTFEYEMLYDQTDTPTTPPTLYIRSRKVNEVTGSETEVPSMACFDMTSFLETFKGTDGYTRFYIKCLTGTKDGEDVYTSISTEPFALKFE